jgi:hypothetical protein
MLAVEVCVMKSAWTRGQSVDGLVILWGLCVIVGYYIGKPKGRAESGAALGCLLGPIGWIITARSKGKQKECPYCHTLVHPAMSVCPFCQKQQ